ncbi:MAG: hypothetical protein WC787_03950 [Patescibacteria group bacterium]|jgi:hypothetical protein
MSSLRATVESIQNDRATVVFEDGQKLVVGVSSLEGIPKQGSDVRVIVTVPSAEDAGRQALARELLNEILAP